MRVDQWGVYFVGAILGMTLPALLYVTFISAGSDIRGLGIAAALAQFSIRVEEQRVADDGPARKDPLGPEDDAALLRFGIGFTDVVKLPSRNAAALKPSDYRTWAPRLLERLARYQPTVACFHGVTGFRAFLRYGLDRDESVASLGPQPLALGPTRFFVVPNPSPAR